MQYSHQSLLKQMMEKGTNQQKILDYFEKEGYTESEILSAITDYERDKELSPTPSEPVETTIKTVPKSTDLRRTASSTKIIVSIGMIVIFALAAIMTYILFQ